MRKRELILIISLLLKSESAFSQIKICEIKFNQKNGLDALETQMNKRFNFKKYRNNNIFKCYKIGVDHDNNKIPITNSTIYACCRNQ